MLDLDRLAAFVHTAENLSFSEAAKQLQLTEAIINTVAAGW